MSHAHILDLTSQCRAAKVFAERPTPDQVAYCVTELLSHAHLNEMLAAENPNSRHHREWAAAARACAAVLKESVI